MLTKNSKKNEIDEFLEGKGDFVQIDHLNRFIKLFPPIGMRKYAYIKLARIYLNKAMFIDAAKMFNHAAVNSLTFKEKQENYIKEAKSYVRALKFESAIRAMKKAFSEASQKEKLSLYKDLVEYYKKVGLDLESSGKVGQAMMVYERLIRMNLDEEEKKETKEKLLSIYKKLGKVKEYDFLKSLKWT